MKSEIIFRYNYVHALLFCQYNNNVKDVVTEEISQVAAYMGCSQFQYHFFASSHSKLELFKKLTIILVCLICCFTSQSTTMVITGRAV